MLLNPGLAIGLVFALALMLVARESTLRSEQRYLTEKTILLGSQVVSGGKNVTIDSDGSAIIGYNHQRFLKHSETTWSFNTYAIEQLARHSRSAEMFVLLDTPQLYSNNAKSTVDVLVENELVRKIQLNLPFLSKMASLQFEPSNLYPTAVEYSPLDARSVYLVKIPQRQERSLGSFATVTVRTNNFATAHVRTIGLYLRYQPSLVYPLTNPYIAYLLALFVGVITTCIIAFTSRGLDVGKAQGPTAVSILILGALTLFTRDGWDFPLWVRLSNFVTFGGGDPSYSWTASPLWAFIPGIASPWTAVVFRITGEASEVTTGLFLKFLLFVCFVFNASLIVRISRTTGVGILAALVLGLSPLSVSVLSWGARDTVAVSFVLSMIYLSMRGQLVPAALCAIVASSVDEYYLPTLLFSPIVRFSINKGWRSSLLALIIAIASGCGFICQWVLLPAAVRNGTVSFRINYDFGAATWQALLQSLGLMPPALRDRPGLLFVLLYGIVTSVILICLTKKLIEMRSTTSYVSSVDTLLPYFTLMVTCFFVSYSRVDPQEWFGLLALYVACVARRILPIWLAVLYAWSTGLVMYVHFGIHEFLNPAFFQPLDVGLFVIRGAAEPPLLLIALASIVIVSGYLCGVKPQIRGGISIVASVVLLFVLCFIVAPGEFRASDMIMLGAFGALALLAITWADRISSASGGQRFWSGATVIEMLLNPVFVSFALAICVAADSTFRVK